MVGKKEQIILFQPELFTSEMRSWVKLVQKISAFFGKVLDKPQKCAFAGDKF